MRAIGLRAEPTAVVWAVVEGTRQHPVLVDHGKTRFPAAYSSVADQLASVRGMIIDTIERNSVDVGAIRLPESNRRGGGKKSDDARLRLEGVLMEACAAANIPLSVAGSIVTIERYMGSNEAKSYLKGDDLRGLQWPKKDWNSREAILVAVAALEE